jgi:hypothetical protein
MKLRISSIFPALGILCFVAAAIPGSIRAQAPAGPLPAAQSQSSPASAASPQNLQPRPETRTSIFGQWKLNLDESDDPRKKMQDASTSRGSGSRGGSGVSIAGFPIGGHGGSGGSQGGENDEERLRTQNAISPANVLALAKKIRRVRKSISPTIRIASKRFSPMGERFRNRIQRKRLRRRLRRIGTGHCSSRMRRVLTAAR